MKFFFGKWDSRVLNGFGQLAGEEGLKLTEMCQESMNRYAGVEGRRLVVSRCLDCAVSGFTFRCDFID
jgi:hypothetical protein